MFGKRSVSSGQFDESGPMRGSFDKRSAIIKLVDAFFNIPDKKFRQFIFGTSVPPMIFGIIYFQMDSCGNDNMHTTALAHCNGFKHVSPAIGGHGIYSVSYTHLTLPT